MTDAELLEATVATEIDRLARMAHLGDRGTAGPEAEPVGFIDAPIAQGVRWQSGWWVGAAQRKAHPGRVGGPIGPFATVVHTTDMLPEEWDALLNAWTTKPSDGACAHFLIGRDASHGVVQLVAVNRNANHAGGPGHGVFDTATAKNIHPNTVTVGIELHCAGGVRMVGAAWRLVEDGKAHGMPIPAFDVIADPQRPGRGWHVVTDYQRAQLAALLVDLELVLAPMPPGLVARSTGEAVPSWGVPKSGRVVGHVSLDPTHRSDPWPATMAWLNAR